MSKPLVPADLLKSLPTLEKPAKASATPAPKPAPGPKSSVKTSAKPQGKGGAAHMRSSNRGK